MQLMSELVSDHQLPIIFLALLGISMLVYAILDGYDLGIGMLMINQNETDRDLMIASIGPFWDANETWLVLGVGILLVAFPMAHGLVLGTLYTPVALMLAGLILRGVSFDFRAKARVAHKKLWDTLFALGSLIASTTQGYMLGKYIVGFESNPIAEVFCIISAACVASAYLLMGACWLILKTTGQMQRTAVARARAALILTATGLVLVSIVNPLASPTIYNKWLALPEALYLLPLPTLCVILISYLYITLKQLPKPDDKHCGRPFALAIGIFVLSFTGLAYSFYPYIVPDTLTIWQAASAPESLRVVLLGCVVVLPAIFIYTALSYWIFRGKSRELSYY